MKDFKTARDVELYVSCASTGEAGRHVGMLACWHTEDHLGIDSKSQR